MRPYHDHSSAKDRDALLEVARDGVVVLVSDAGTPLISDPGYKLVRAAREAGIVVFTAPGPSAAIAALSISGLPTDRFLFAGFLPSKAKARGPRLGASLAAMAAVLGNREAAVARELTKKFEEVVTGSLAELAAHYVEMEPKGEIVVIIGPPGDPVAETGDVDSALRRLLETLPTAKAAGQIAKRFGIDRADVYARATAIKSGA
jgi:16S rRNA (cytidine1402-2'-O)-methyltransferase